VSVVSWLDGYVPQGHAEVADVDRLASALSTGDVWTRSTLLHVTGSAVVVHRATNRVLLRWHERYGIWNHVVRARRRRRTASLGDGAAGGAGGAGAARSSPFPGPDPAILLIEIVPVPAAEGEPDHEHADVNYVLTTDDPDAIAPEHDDAELRWLPFAEARKLVNFHVGALLDRVRDIL